MRIAAYDEEYELVEVNMSFSPVPNYCVPDIFAVTPRFLAQKGIRLLLLDLDNTLSPYSEDMPPERVLAWMQAMRDAGVTLYIISNNRSQKRIEDYARCCDIPCMWRAGKPKPAPLFRAMEELGYTQAETALMGDQIFTDALAANRAGVTSIVVKPIKMQNILFHLRYGVEQPFRKFGKKILEELT